MRKVRGSVVKRLRKMTNNRTDDDLESITEDEARVANKEIQDIHDKAIARVNAAVQQKVAAVENASA